MSVLTARLQLDATSLVMAQQIVDGSGRDAGAWHPQYPLADELVPLRGLASDSSGQRSRTVFTLYQIRLRSNGLAIGGTGFFGPPDADGCVELGCGLVEAERGHGFATEALCALVALAGRNGAPMIKADTEVGNVASRRALLKAGFREVDRSDALAYFRRELLP